MGERLWGDNRVRWGNGTTPAGPRRDAAVGVSDWAGRILAPPGLGPGEPVGADGEASLAFRLETMCGGWREQYHVAGPTPFAFGTPPSPLTLRLGSVYPYPDEKLDVGVNLNVTTRGVGAVASCRAAIRFPGGELPLLDTDDVAASFWTADKPRPALLDGGFVDARNLITLSVGAPACPSMPPPTPCGTAT